MLLVGRFTAKGIYMKINCRAIFAAASIFCHLTMISGEPESVTDYEDWRQFCLEAAIGEDAFSCFRRHPKLIEVMEHVSVQQGEACLKIALRAQSDFEKYLELFRLNDEVGNPHTYDYEDAGWFSPTTLRYVKVASDLHVFFGSLESKKIIEIGGGYGGQCGILLSLFPSIEYTLIDLPETLALAKRYLEARGIANVKFQTLEQFLAESEPKAYDLILSNYAFSECNREIQRIYLEKIIRNCPQGYLIVNQLLEQIVPSPYTHDELQHLLRQEHPELYIHAENPRTHANNRLYRWDDRAEVEKVGLNAAWPH